MKAAIEKTTTIEALLGMLSLGAMSGYAIRQTIEGSIGNFWRESYGQIYPTLKRLVGEGLAEIRPERTEAAGREGRTMYGLTAAGKRRLRAWLETSSTPQVPRNEMLLKIFFAAQGSPGVVRRQVEAFRSMHEGELKRFAGIRKHLQREYARHPELPYWLITLEYGEMESEAMLAWCERTLRTCERLEEVEHAS